MRSKPIPGTPMWRKSTYSDSSGGNCVEAAALPGRRAVRDSKNPGPALSVSARTWRRFVLGVKAGSL